MWLPHVARACCANVFFCSVRFSFIWGLLLTIYFVRCSVFPRLAVGLPGLLLAASIDPRCAVLCHGRH